jgi:uncharacterized membrane protein
MNRLDWIAQILMAVSFLFVGINRVISFRRQNTGHQPVSGWKVTELPREWSWVIAVLEIGGAVALVVPFKIWQPDILPRLAAVGLALLTLSVCIYRVRHKEPAAPVMALFLLTLFVVVGRL